MESDLQDEAERLLGLANRIDSIIGCYSSALLAGDVEGAHRAREQAAALERECFPEVQAQRAETENRLRDGAAGSGNGTDKLVPREH
jgi:hypothetical protein